MWRDSWANVPDTATKERAEMLARVFDGEALSLTLNGRAVILWLPLSESSCLEVASPTPLQQAWTGDELFWALDFLQEHHVRGAELDIAFVVTTLVDDIGMWMRSNDLSIIALGGHRGGCDRSASQPTSLVAA